MSDDEKASSRRGVLGPIAGLGARAATATLRPIVGVAGAAAEAGLSLERRAVNRVLESDELERVVVVAINSVHIQAALKQALESDGAAQLIDSLFDSGLIDRFLERLLASDSLWTMIDEIAGSPAVTAAISQQGLGFADQVGDEVRARSRKADDWMERAARRLIGRQPKALPIEPDASTS
ncbi:MAG TPA: hypothetical protein VLW51_07950 [Solirubrobacteraceae bacterium]|nr:hypothetical protein [Solirubrobacteraceae bacterium]